MQFKPTTFASAATLGLAMAMAGSSPALAEGTAAGVTITNETTATYDVDGIAQNALTATASVTVDRKINVMVSEVGGTATTIAPGKADAVTTFLVQNLSNAPVDLMLTLDQQANGQTTVHGSKLDSFDLTGLKLYRDNGDNIFQAADDAEVSLLDAVDADGQAVIFTVGKVELGLQSGAAAGVKVTAKAYEVGNLGELGPALVETTTANTDQMDTVFADGAGATDSARDASFSALDSYVIYTAGLTLTKTVKIISDPFNNSTLPKAVPGSVVEYCVIAANGAGRRRMTMRLAVLRARIRTGWPRAPDRRNSCSRQQTTIRARQQCA